MINKIKKTSLIIIVIGLVLILFGVTYSFFNYTEFSNELVTNNGEVYMKMYKDSNNITLNNVFPETYKKALYQNGEDGILRTDNVIEFTVIGKNTYNNPVYYEIDLEYGDDVNNKERIEDRYLRFELLDITDSNNVITLIKKKNYFSIDNKKIYVDTINTTNYTRTYRLRMWYDEKIIISDTDPAANFRASDLNNDKGNEDLPIYTDLYASVKVNVYGDFIEKTLYDETPSTCFTYVNVSEYESTPGPNSNKNININPKFLANPSNLDDEGLAITDYDITCGFDIVFPKTINNKPVVFVGDFHNMDNRDRNSISSIYISENIEEFDSEYYDGLFSSGNLSNIVVDPNNSVFDSRENCNALIETNSNTLLKGLSNTIIPNTVTSIGDHAFFNLYDLTEIYIPSSVVDISNYSFWACSNLESIIVDSNNSVYDSRNNCNAIINTSTNELIDGCKNTIIPNTVTSIGNFAFEYCSSLTNITIPNSVTSIGNYAFEYCSLTNITIPNSVTSIGNSAFEKCSSLTSITIPNSVTSIGYSAFSCCTSLTNITIPDSVTSIRNYAFEYCSSLTNITIPNSVTSIGSAAFSNCSSLTNITIPNSVTSIGSSAFSDCSSLTNITIPNSVTSIEESAFFRCSSLTNITIPNSVTSIGHNAFLYCSSLTDITIPNSVTYIGILAFEYCSSLTNITIPNSVTYIGYDAFYGCNHVKTLRIPSSISYINNHTFYSLNSLTDIYVSWTNPSSQVSLGNTNPIEKKDNLRLHVPSGTGYLYEQHSYFKDYLIIEDN